MQTVNNNTPEQINSALFAIGDDLTKQNVQTKNAIKSSESTLQKQIDKLTDSLKNNGGLIIGGTYDINISGNASTSTNATNAINATNAVNATNAANADKASKDSAGNVITTTYATKAEVPTKTSELTNDSNFVTSGQLATVATSGNYNDLSNKPTIPTDNNQLTNGAGYITSSGSITGSSGSCTGNASTATTLQTARTINGTSFDGSADVTTAKWGTARNIYITDSTGTNTGSAVSVNGSSYATLRLPSAINATVTLAKKIRTGAPNSPENGEIWIG